MLNNPQALPEMPDEIKEDDLLALHSALCRMELK